MIRLVYPSDDRRAAGSTTAMQIFAASDLARLRADHLELRARRRGVSAELPVEQLRGKVELLAASKANVSLAN
jgi:hypothetical protein